MDPWEIIGWAIVMIVLIPIVIVVLMIVGHNLLIWLTRRYLHLKTRNLPPKKGQVWWSQGVKWTIGDRHSAGHFTITSRDSGCSVSLGMKDDEWKRMVQHRKAFLLVKEPT